MPVADQTGGDGADLVMSLTKDLVARCERVVFDREPVTENEELSSEDYLAAAQDLLQRNGPGPLWVFAYGSLIWKPTFQPVEVRRGTLAGWRRSFCLELRSWRGTPERPGLMLGLKRGGACDGLVLRAEEADKQGLLIALLQREVSSPGHLRNVLHQPVATLGGTVNALVFWAETDAEDGFREHDLDVTTDVLATACGYAGSCASYLYETAAALSRHAIHDPYVWQLQVSVAAAIQRRNADQYTPIGRVRC